MTRTARYYKVRSVVRAVFFLILAMILFLTLGIANKESANGASTFKAQEFHQAQRLIHQDHLTVPWDGRVSYNERTEFCVEAFNGTRHDIRWHHLVPPGFYLKVCQSGDYYVNDGVPFRHMHRW